MPPFYEWSDICLKPSKSPKKLGETALVRVVEDPVATDLDTRYVPSSFSVVSPSNCRNINKL